MSRTIDRPFYEVIGERAVLDSHIGSAASIVVSVFTEAAVARFAPEGDTDMQVAKKLVLFELAAQDGYQQHWQRDRNENSPPSLLANPADY